MLPINQTTDFPRSLDTYMVRSCVLECKDNLQDMGLYPLYRSKRSDLPCRRDDPKHQGRISAMRIIRCTHSLTQEATIITFYQ